MYDAKNSSFRIESKLEDALQNWGASTRISPVWRFHSSEPRTIGILEPYSEKLNIWFLSADTFKILAHQFKTDEMQSEWANSIWLTLGFYNIISISKNRFLDDEILQTCEKYNIIFEKWSCKKDIGKKSCTIHDTSTSAIDQNTNQRNKSNPGATISKLRHRKGKLSQRELECLTILESINARATGEYTVILEDAEEAIERAGLLDHHEFPSGKISEEDQLPNQNNRIIELNASLSRIASQAFSGTSPLSMTECHFWPHSFLGIAVANLALRNTNHFLRSKLIESRYQERLRTMAQMEATEYQRISLRARYEPRNKDQNGTPHVDITFGVDGIALDGLTESLSNADKLALVSYFSGRDGFKVGELHSSAPLTSVSKAINSQWSLNKVTRDFSTYVLLDLTTSLRDTMRNDLAALESLGLTSSHLHKHFSRDAENVVEYASKKICISIIESRDLGFSSPSNHIRGNDEHPFLSNKVEYILDDTVKSLIYIFEFYHFYWKDSLCYLSNALLSSDFLFNSDQELYDEVKRLLLAISLEVLDEEEWGAVAVLRLMNFIKNSVNANSNVSLKNVQTFLDDTLVIERILEDLHSHRAILEVFNTCLRSKTLQEKMTEERFEIDNFRRVSRRGQSEWRRYSYRDKVGVFGSEAEPSTGSRISNPLLFIRNFSRETEASDDQSSWLLHMLAFNYT